MLQDEEQHNSKQQMIFDFFEEATLAEMMVLPGCSRKKAEVLLELRPFGSYAGLVCFLRPFGSYAGLVC
jgi:hypothetical protein